MNETVRMVLDTASRIFEDQCTPQAMEQAETGQWPEPLWREVEAAGLTNALVPEYLGGAGLAFEEALAVVRLAGYYAAPIPLGETMVAARILADAGQDVPEGPLTIAGSAGPTARAAGAGLWEIHGRWDRVPWGSQCSAVVALARSESGVRLVCLRPAQARIEPGANLANEFRDSLYVEALQRSESELPGWNGGADDLLELGALVRSQQIAGAAQRALEFATRYARERRQFGRPIARFQAIQQQIAAMAGQVAAATAAAEAAAAAWGTDKAGFMVATAKARASEAAGHAAAVAHQVHGAMGFTREHPLHYSTRRLWSWRDEFGSQTYWQDRLGAQVLDLGAEGLWPYLTRRPRHAE